MGHLQGVVIAEDTTRILVFYDKANLLPKFFFSLFAPALFAAFQRIRYSPLMAPGQKHQSRIDHE
jgi:hypothetical protein